MALGVRQFTASAAASMAGIAAASSLSAAAFLSFAAHKKGRQEFFEIKELLPTIISFPYIPFILHAPNLA